MSIEPGKQPERKPEKLHRNVFVPFFNDQILDNYRTLERIPVLKLERILLRSLVYAHLLTTEKFIIPTVDLVQSPILTKLSRDISPLVEQGLIIFSGADCEPSKIIEIKKRHFQKARIHPTWFEPNSEDRLSAYSAHFERRNISTTKDLYHRWKTSVERVDKEATYLEAAPETFILRAQEESRSVLSALEIFHNIPTLLDGQAFLWPVVIKQGGSKILEKPEVRYNAEMALASHWVLSHLHEYDATVLCDVPGVARFDCGLAEGHAHSLLSVNRIERTLRMSQLFDFAEKTTIQNLVRLRSSPIFQLFRQEVLVPIFNGLEHVTPEFPPRIKCLEAVSKTFLRGFRGSLPRIKEFLEAALDATQRFDQSTPEAQQIRTNITKRPTEPIISTMATAKKVFIGHGKSTVWRDLKDFLQDRLSLKWDEFNRVPTAGSTTIDRLKQMLSEAEFAFIILTAEDETAEGDFRARENAVHELGLFQGSLGFDRAIVLLEEGCNEFSNIHGLTQVRFPENNLMAKSEEIRQLLESKGIV